MGVCLYLYKETGHFIFLSPKQLPVKWICIATVRRPREHIGWSNSGAELYMGWNIWHTRFSQSDSYAIKISNFESLESVRAMWRQQWNDWCCRVYNIWTQFQH